MTDPIALDSGPLGRISHPRPNKELMDLIERAAEFWAESRRKGKPTADPKELDCDAILAAQAESVGAVVATENIGHLAQFVTARSWREIVAA